LFKKSRGNKIRTLTYSCLIYFFVNYATYLRLMSKSSRWGWLHWSHLEKELVESRNVIVLDNLINGHEKLLDKCATFVKCDLGKERVLESVFD
jgi:hypothetical protein